MVDTLRVSVTSSLKWRPSPAIECEGWLATLAHAARWASLQSTFALRATVDNLRLSVA